MTAHLSPYTRLESLLLFQSLHAYGVDSHVFQRVSELLKTNPHITQDTHYDAGRLSPDALRSFYLHILKDEIKNDAHDQDSPQPNPDGKPTRKRKAPSPSLPTVQDSLQHQHLIPKLVNKLYACYRAAIVEHIRQDEERYDKLQKDLQQIERGDWDEQLKDKPNGKPTSQSPPLPNHSPPPASAHANKPDPKPANAPNKLALTPEPSIQSGQHAGKPVPSPSARKKQGPPQTPRPLASHPTQTQPNANPPSAANPPHPHAHPPTPGNHAVPTTGSQHSPYQGFPQHLQAGSLPFQQHAKALGQIRAPQLAPNSGGPPLQHPPAHQHFSASQPPAVQNPYQQRSYTPMAGQPPYLPQHPQPGQPPPQGGYMLPPFQVAPQDPSQSQQQTVSTPISARQPSAKGTPHAGRAFSTPLQPLKRASASTTPVNIRAIITALSTPNTGKTAWKHSVSSLGATPISRPDVSPIDDFDWDHREKPRAQPKAARKSRAKVKAKEKEKELEPEESDRQTVESSTAPEIETRQGRSARRKAPPKRGRPGSIASSHTQASARERSRSYSVLSHTETIAADTESHADSRIKSEDVEDMPTPSQMSTRGRAATRLGNKRKRSSPDVEDTSGTPVPGLREPLRSPNPTSRRVVIAPRHFSRMCAPLLSDIASHKHASTFTTPVKAKDAEGYYDIIKRPTDLKSIQKAVSAGAKQVAAFASSSSDSPAGTSSPGSIGGIVELPRTADVTPPRAIVNSAQLERELMRMFVNAVMFNPGEGGVVEDAREMFEVVVRSVGSWRSVEGGRREVEIEETPEVDDDGPVEKKRRKG